MRTLLVALLFGFPILGDAADDWPASNWIWQLPAHQQFPSLSTREEFRRNVTFSPLNRHDPIVNFQQVIGPPRKGNGIEAAEILNSLRMDRYRQDCEELKRGQMHGAPAAYPTQIPMLRSP